MEFFRRCESPLWRLALAVHHLPIFPGSALAQEHSHFALTRSHNHADFVDACARRYRCGRSSSIATHLLLETFVRQPRGKEIWLSNLALRGLRNDRTGQRVARDDPAIRYLARDLHLEERYALARRRKKPRREKKEILLEVDDVTVLVRRTPYH